MMASADTSVLLLLLLQPLLVGFAVVAVGLLRLAVWGLGVLQGGARQRGRGLRFFECGAVPRLVGSLRYSAPVLTFCALFLIYDIDLLFFLTEVGPLEQETWFQGALLLVYLGLLIVGLHYDLWRYGLLWAL